MFVSERFYGFFLYYTRVTQVCVFVKHGYDFYDRFDLCFGRYAHDFSVLVGRQVFKEQYQ